MADGRPPLIRRADNGGAQAIYGPIACTPREVDADGTHGLSDELREEGVRDVPLRREQSGQACIDLMLRDLEADLLKSLEEL